MMEAAQRTVNRFVADEISYLLRTDKPMLVTSTKPVWRVPVILAFPHHGPVGQVGTVDVDAETGQLLVTEDQIKSIHKAALELAIRHNAPKG